MTKAFALTKEERLAGETTVSNLFREGKSIMAYPFRVVWLSMPAREHAGVRILVSVPKKKLKRAVWRNSVKRRLREAYRLNKMALNEQATALNLELHLAFIWIPSEVLDYARIEKKMLESLHKLEDLIGGESGLNDLKP